ncbi:AraC family transcriptional regulator [Pseudalkalibacillus decolorationis]|uniref:AraC family transcriptional regulator n=1 Tax=Pseudalkalibacillus decolorationis TaxID=163879 RepID=UPI002148ECBE|nr:AraC family transcriptional regulator [Pseudalkalibacillus decolorationis]
MYCVKESVGRLNQHTVLVGHDVSFRINYWGVDSNLTSNPVHRHSSFEICYVLSGEGTYLDNGNIYSLYPGTLFCSRPGITHQIQSEQGLFLFFVCFEVDEGKSSREYVENYLSMAKQESIIVYNGETSSTVSLWKSLLVPLQKRWAVASHELPNIAHALLVSFLNMFMDNEGEFKTNTSPPHFILQQAKTFIRDNLEKKLSLEMIAQYLNVSTRHLSRLFSDGINESFISFIRKERVKQATYLLKTTHHSIKEIADMTGFGSVHYFTRVFHKETGHPPGRFRKEYH